MIALIAGLAGMFLAWTWFIYELGREGERRRQRRNNLPWWQKE